MMFVIEPIETQRPRTWGDMDPATKESSSYKPKSPGAVKPEDSIVTEANGFTNIVTLSPGVSPAEYIRKRTEGK
jgi:hypothetical protein